jgi:hypothetical protein
MWRLLSRLYAEFFGPDAPPPPEDGFLHRNISNFIEQQLLTDESWTPEEDDSPDTPLNVRANLILRRLIECGWLREERIGVRAFIQMRPDVQQFLAMLVDFAERGPEYIGGRAQVIYSTLRDVEKDPEQHAPGFAHAAREARQIVASLAATGHRVQDVMERLSLEHTPAEFVRSFFQRYISEIYIADYQDLRTAQHPLRNRLEILRIVQELRFDPERREAILAGYCKHMRLPTREAALAAFERDVQKFNALERVELYLEKLDATVGRINRRVVGYLNYTLRNQGKIEQLIDRAIERVVAAAQTEGGVPTTFASGWLFSPDRLREPQREKAPLPRRPIEKRVVSARTMALHRLHRAIRAHRDVSPQKLIAYLERHGVSHHPVSSDDLTVESIHDLCALLTLGRAALRATCLPLRAQRADALLAGLRKYSLQIVEPRALTANDFARVPRFHVTQRSA